MSETVHPPDHNRLISIVVSTRDRAQQLREALSYYDRIRSTERWELVVVDNGSADETNSVLQDFAKSTAICVRLTTEPIKGLSRSRNRGWRLARGGIIAFTDDDCYPDTNFVDQVASCMQERTLDYMGGRVLLHDPEDAPVTIQIRSTPLDLPPRVFLPAGIIHGANMALRRDVIEALNGFDERLGPGTRIASGEDIEFLSRAAAAGYFGGYDPRPVIRHHHRRKTVEQVERLRRAYDIGRGAYYMACMLDRRRINALKYWYWDVRKSLVRPTRSWRRLKMHLREVQGAIKYCIARAQGIMKAASRESRERSPATK